METNFSVVDFCHLFISLSLSPSPQIDIRKIRRKICSIFHLSRDALPFPGIFKYFQEVTADMDKISRPCKRLCIASRSSCYTRGKWLRGNSNERKFTIRGVPIYTPLYIYICIVYMCYTFTNKFQFRRDEIIGANSNVF